MAARRLGPAAAQLARRGERTQWVRRMRSGGKEPTAVAMPAVVALAPLMWALASVVEVAEPAARSAEALLCGALWRRRLQRRLRRAPFEARFGGDGRLHAEKQAVVAARAEQRVAAERRRVRFVRRRHWLLGQVACIGSLRAVDSGGKPTRSVDPFRIGTRTSSIYHDLGRLAAL
eukprot:5000354-Pleurochrysis_carterae.AAC.2